MLEPGDEAFIPAGAQQWTCAAAERGKVEECLCRCRGHQPLYSSSGAPLPPGLPPQASSTALRMWAVRWWSGSTAMDEDV